MSLVLFDEKFLPQAIALIDQAQITLEISTFKAQMTHKPSGKKLLVFFEKLIEKAKEGIKIKMLVNWNTEKQSVARTNQYVIEEMKKHNVQVKTLPNNRCCHAKIIIADRATALIGSHNLSISSVHKNFELSYLTSNREVVHEISERFLYSWNDAKKY